MDTIRALRRARGWTQFELALEIGVQPQAIYLWESGRRTPQVSPLRRLGVVFGRCSDDIVLVGAPTQPDAAPWPHADGFAEEPALDPALDSPGRLTTRPTRRR